MQQLEIFGTTPQYTNVAMNRDTISTVELHERVLNSLLHGIAIFSFLTKDGETRTVVATLNEAIIPSKEAQFIAGHPQLLLSFKTAYEAIESPESGNIGGTNKDVYDMNKDAVTECALATKAFLAKLSEPAKERKLSPDVQNYYDLTKQGWGRYKIDNLLSLIVL